MNILVTRSEDNGTQTIGTLHIFDEQNKEVLSCKTLELPDKGNARAISCIPKGEYDCIKVGATASIPYPHILLLNVPNRDGICIHRANYVRQLKGCIAVGEKHVDIDGDGEMDVTNSTKVFDQIMAIVPDKFKIEIR